MHFEQPVKNVIWSNEGYGNAVAIDTGKLYFIDAMANVNAMREFRMKVESIFSKKASALLLTHHHGDHIFGNQLFKDLNIISSHKTREILIKWGEEVFKPEIIKDWEGYSHQNFNLTLPNLTFHKEIIFHDDYPLKFIRLDGHVEGASMLWDIDNKTVIAGDLIFNHRFPYGADMTSDVVKWRKALNYIINLKPEVTISGHGPPATLEDLTEIHTFLKDVIKYYKTNKMIKLEEIIKDKNFPEYYGKGNELTRERSIKSWHEKFYPNRE